jgi:hypothetical protein
MNKFFQYFYVLLWLSLLFISLLLVLFNLFFILDIIDVINVDSTYYSDLPDVFFSSDTMDVPERNDSFYSSESSSSSSSFNRYSCSNFLGKNDGSSKVFKDLKHDIKVLKDVKVFKDIKNNSKLAIHKLKVIKRTFAWFFKGSRPGGGRGL